MWKKIKENGIVTRTQNPQGAFSSTIPEGTAALTASQVTKMLEWIYDEFITDSSANPTIFQSASFEAKQAFITRNTSRLLSYVNHVCLLEHILMRLYEETISRLQVVEPTIVINETERSARESEVKGCFIFRNKVSAHTAYGSPRAEDNAAMEFHSLVALLSSSYDETGSGDSFALGAVSVRLSGQDPSTKLPCLGLKDLHPKMLKHIEEWTTMLIEPCQIVRKDLPKTVGDTEYSIEG